LAAHGGAIVRTIGVLTPRNNFGDLANQGIPILYPKMDLCLSSATLFPLVF